MTTIVWFRQDLRTRDNPALAAAVARGPVLPLFILDDETPGPRWRWGGASRWWLHHSLAALGADLGCDLLVFGQDGDVAAALGEEFGQLDPGEVGADDDHAFADRQPPVGQAADTLRCGVAVDEMAELPDAEFRPARYRACRADILAVEKEAEGLLDELARVAAGAASEAFGLDLGLARGADGDLDGFQASPPTRMVSRIDPSARGSSVTEWPCFRASRTAFSTA